MAFCVLVVEADSVIQALLRAILMRMGHLVDVCEDGAMADKLLQEREYDLLVIDLDLPLLRGSQVVRNVSERGLGIPVILLAEGVAEEDMLPSERGNMICIGKPFGVEELRAAVRKLLS